MRSAILRRIKRRLRGRVRRAERRVPAVDVSTMGDRREAGRYAAEFGEVHVEEVLGLFVEVPRGRRELEGRASAWLVEHCAYKRHTTLKMTN